METMSIHFDETPHSPLRIVVVGAGGGGCNAVKNMALSGLRGVDLLATNTDIQALNTNPASLKIQLGAQITEGLGTGSDPEKGRRSAEESIAELERALTGAKMVFVTCGEGGGTGTGAAPVIAEVSRRVGALTVGVVTKPFNFEGKMRMRRAEEGIERLRSCVDSIIIIHNQKLIANTNQRISIPDAFKLADGVLLNAVQGITDIIQDIGVVNVDFADVVAIMKESGVALMGMGNASGEKRIEEATRMAIDNPLLDDDIRMDGASGVLVNITGGESLGLHEVDDAMNSIIAQTAHEEANMKYGVVIDPMLDGDVIKVTVIATGFAQAQQRAARPHAANFGQELGRTRRVVHVPAATMGLTRVGSALDDDMEAPPPPPRESSSWPSSGGRNWADEVGDRRPSHGSVSREREMRSGACAQPFPDSSRAEYPSRDYGRERDLLDPENDMEIPTFIRKGRDAQKERNK